MIKYVRKLSTQGVYIILLLIHAFRNENTPSWAKNIILGALAYFLSPFDSIPDLAPFIGLTDDLGVMTFGLVTIACYIDDDVRAKAYTQLSNIMDGDVDDVTVSEVDGWL